MESLNNFAKDLHDCIEIILENTIMPKFINGVLTRFEIYRIICRLSLIFILISMEHTLLNYCIMLGCLMPVMVMVIDEINLHVNRHELLVMDFVGVLTIMLEVYNVLYGLRRGDYWWLIHAILVIVLNITYSLFLFEYKKKYEDKQ